MTSQKPVAVEVIYIRMKSVTAISICILEPTKYEQSWFAQRLEERLYVRADDT